MVVDVAGDEDAVDLRGGLVVDHEIALRVDLEPVAEDLGVGLVADRHEQAVDRHRPLLAGVGVAQAETVDLGVAEDLLDGGVGVELDLRVAPGAVDHDPAAPELVAPVEEVDLRREAGQVGRLLEGRVAAADDGDLLVPEEEAVAGGAGGDAAPAQARLALEPEPDGRGAGGDDDRSAAISDAARPQPERPRGEVDAVDVDVDDVRPEALGLLAEAAISSGPGCPPGSPGSSRRRS